MAKKKKISKDAWGIISVVAVLVVLLFLVFYVSGQDQAAVDEGISPDSGDTSSSGDLSAESLAKCLTEQGDVMYGTTWCSHCNAQKEMFGEYFNLIDFVDCDKERSKCSAAGVQGYPTWNINGKNYPGQKPLSQLASIAGC